MLDFWIWLSIPKQNLERNRSHPKTRLEAKKQDSINLLSAFWQEKLQITKEPIGGIWKIRGPKKSLWNWKKLAGGRFVWPHTWRVKSSICCSAKGVTSQIGWFCGVWRGHLKPTKLVLDEDLLGESCSCHIQQDSSHLWGDVLKRLAVPKLDSKTYSTGRIFIRVRRHENHGGDGYYSCGGHEIWYLHLHSQNERMELFFFGHVRMPTCKLFQKWWYYTLPGYWSYFHVKKGVRYTRIWENR